MAENTSIEWCDATFNPWMGCTKVSREDTGGGGCDHCYAEAWSKRAGDKVGKWGPGAPRVRTSAAMWRQPARWNAQAFVQCDVFDNEVPTLWRQQLMTLVADTPNIDWLFLTKRIGNARKMLADASMHDGRLLTANDEYRPPANLWIGATIVNQEEADRDIPKLLATPAAVRFLSMEPLLEHVDIGWTFADSRVIACPRCRFSTNRLWHGPCPNDGATLLNDVGVAWVISGGESGHGARPMHPDWARSLRDQCAAAGVPFLFKQWGEWVPTTWEASRHTGALDSIRGDDIAFTALGPAGRQVAIPVVKVGKKAAGRLLDGKTHDGFPEVRNA